MDSREERRRFCLEMATRNARNTGEVVDAAKQYEEFLEQLDVKPEETPAERPGPKAKRSGNPTQIP